MEHLELLSSFVFPNDTHVHWNIMIVIYPYITGIVAGAFIVSALAHVFKVESLYPIAKFSLIFALSWLLFVTAPLLNHLGHPERALNMLFTPNVVGPSMMAGFGYIYMSYSILLIFEILFVYRYEMVLLKENSIGIKKVIYNILTLGTNDKSEKGQKIDHKVAFVLASIGIPLAASLHGYVGFIFGAVKTVDWWFTPLMPIIFLLSAAILMFLSLKNVSRNTLLIVSPIVSFMLLAQVLFMRWNIVIGGQVMAKSERGFSVYHPNWFDKEGILVTIIMLVAPIVTMWLLSKIFPLWDNSSLEQK